MPFWQLNSHGFGIDLLMVQEESILGQLQPCRNRAGLFRLRGPASPLHGQGIEGLAGLRRGGFSRGGIEGGGFSAMVYARSLTNPVASARQWWGLGARIFPVHKIHPIPNT